MLVLGIETSCDETAAAVVRDGRDVLSNIVFSQIDHHQAFGGVVPEIASRCHVEALPGIVSEALRTAGVRCEELDAIAATRGPGLSTSLLVGFTAAKALALRLDRPLLGMNHLEGHLFSVFMQQEALAGGRDPDELCPCLVLTASGGHTALTLARGLGDYELVGQTVDDAAGEALDKGAKLLGLGYPGGPAMEKAAQGGNPKAVRFPRGFESRGDDPDVRYQFTFSGLKTALLYHLKNQPLAEGDQARLADLAASYQEAVVDTLLRRVESACRAFELRAIGCAGGVARNRRLREKLTGLSQRFRLPLLLARPEFCTDNAAMIAALASARPDPSRHIAGDRDVDPTWPLA